MLQQEFPEMRNPNPESDSHKNWGLLAYYGLEFVEAVAVIGQAKRRGHISGHETTQATQSRNLRACGLSDRMISFWGLDRIKLPCTGFLHYHPSG
jgi:hypothetical protein